MSGHHLHHRQISEGGNETFFPSAASGAPSYAVPVSLSARPCMAQDSSRRSLVSYTDSLGHFHETRISMAEDTRLLQLCSSGLVPTPPRPPVTTWSTISGLGERMSSDSITSSPRRRLPPLPIDAYRHLSMHSIDSKDASVESAPSVYSNSSMNTTTQASNSIPASHTLPVQHTDGGMRLMGGPPRSISYLVDAETFPSGGPEVDELPPQYGLYP